MSRVAKKPILVPEGLKITITYNEIAVEGKNGVLCLPLHPSVKVVHEDGLLKFSPKNNQIKDKEVGEMGATRGQAASAKSERSAWAMAGTLRALVDNIVEGVTTGFERKLQLVGVGYKAKVEGRILDLSLGLSHPVNYIIPDTITIETPTQTEITVRGVNKELVGQVAANIRAYRKPEPYKGKGIRYVASRGYPPEEIILKEVKKK